MGSFLRLWSVSKLNGDRYPERITFLIVGHVEMKTVKEFENNTRVDGVFGLGCSLTTVN